MSRSVSGGWPSSISRRPATSRWSRRTAASRSSSTAKSTTTASCARSSRRWGARFVSTSDTEVILLRRDALGPRRDARAAMGHVRARAVGSAAAPAAARARSHRQEAALLRRAQRHAVVRIGAEGAPRASVVPAGAIDREALALYVRFGYVPTPRSIYAGVAKLPPGSSITFDRAPRNRSRLVPYWRPSECIAEGRADRAPVRCRTPTRSSSSIRCCATRWRAA